MTDRTDHSYAEGVAHGLRNAAQLLDEMAPRPLEALRLAASILRGLADVSEGAVQCPTCADADRYAANEAEQREAESDPLDSSRDYDEHERAAEPDPLDEDDHRDRLDADGNRLIRRANGRWSFSHAGGLFTLAGLNERHGPLRFAPDATRKDH